METAFQIVVVALANILGGAVAIPQATRLIRHRKVDGVSTLWAGSSVGINLWWIAYGLGAGDSSWAIIPVGVISTVAYVLISVNLVRFSSRPRASIVASLIVPAMIGVALPVPAFVLGGLAGHRHHARHGLWISAAPGGSRGIPISRYQRRFRSYLDHGMDRGVVMGDIRVWSSGSGDSGFRRDRLGDVIGRPGRPLHPPLTRQRQIGPGCCQRDHGSGLAGRVLTRTLDRRLATALPANIGEMERPRDDRRYG